MIDDPEEMEVWRAMDRLSANTDWTLVAGWLEQGQRERARAMAQEEGAQVHRRQGSYQTVESLLGKFVEAENVLKRYRDGSRRPHAAA